MPRSLKNDHHNLPPSSIKNSIDVDAKLADVSSTIGKHVQTFLDADVASSLLRDVQEQTRIALGVISTALDAYSVEELAISYNGGKDCLVLLILLLAGLSQHSCARPEYAIPDYLPSIYIIPPDPFPQVTRFVEDTAERYKLRLDRYNVSMKAAFELYLQGKQQIQDSRVRSLVEYRAEERTREQAALPAQSTQIKQGQIGGARRTKAILVGTRRTDPHGKLLTHFDRTDRGWPDFMRVHPIIDWHYREVWAFLRHLDISYCELYDEGYTSLGGMDDTHPNPALRNAGQDTFRPAYQLEEDKEERLGRDR